MTKWKKALVMAMCVSFGSQIYVNLFTDGFIITLAVVLLGIFMYQYNTLEPIPSGILVGIASPLFRGIILFFQTDIADLGLRFGSVFYRVYPDVAFYCSYGVFFYLYYWNNTRKKTYANYFLCMVFCDFMSNMMEMMVRYGGHPAPLEEMKGLFLVALGRSVVITFVVVSIESYKNLLSRNEHEERYKKLMIMASVFKSEVYFMSKNMVEIEDVMKKAFMLYRTMENEGYPEELKDLSLDISKDVHEIKKDYIRVIKGLQDNFLADLDEGGMKIKDVVQILELDINELIRERKQDIQFIARVRYDFDVDDHFSLMSVLRNLVINGIDSVGDRKCGIVRLDVFPGVGENKDFYLFDVTDNGPGIPAGDMDVIFDPGYSTKFDGETGDINRGVGLTLVRDLVRDKFRGQICAESKEGVYTRFQIKLPKQAVEGGLK
ncbi:sensor histidine kinase [Bacilliculturomica massiliensis]|uniref:sensor histidine kinase n=1 Tax=Bacilliculturomica massiliensis TaxID=1917867 RepID=UPI0013EF228B|nr:ATP-binding protein [Bacilliculturomica massiliensis]